MKYSDLPQAQAPARIVTLPPSAWSATYDTRPQVEAALGLRLPSEREVLTAHTEASKEAAAGGRTGEALEWRFQEALVCWMLATCLCDPNDARKPYFQAADEEVRDAFPPETLRHLWHELEALQLAASPVRPEASETDVLELVDLLLEAAPLDRLSPGRAARVRRVLAFALDELRDASTPDDAP